MGMIDTIRSWFGRREALEEVLRPKTERTYETTTGIAHVHTPSRERAMTFVPFSRCVDIISTGAAGLIASTVKVVRQDTGELVETPRAKAALRLLRHSPDQVHTGFEFLRDVMGDYLVDGNALVHVEKSKGLTYDTPIRLTRLDPDSAYTRNPNRQDIANSVYWAYPFGDSAQRSYSIRDVVHAKFGPRKVASQSDGREFFAMSPLKKLARPISIGRRADGFVDEFFDEGVKNDVAVEIPAEASGTLQERIIEAWEEHITDKRAPLWLPGGAKASILAPNPQSADAKALREYGAVEIGRFYGVPTILLNIEFSKWGAGVEQLARLYFRYGLRQHLDPVLDALSFRLLPEGLIFEIDPTQEVKGDMSAMTSFISAVRPTTNNPAVMSLKEVRDVIGARGELDDDWNWEPGTGTPGNNVVQSSGGGSTDDG